jgi:hypothetical protein
MTSFTRALLTALLLLTVAAPAAAYQLPAVDETTPSCPPVEMVDGVAVIPEGAPADCVYIQAFTETPVDPVPGDEPIAEPMPINLSFEDCAPELAVAVAAGETPIAPAPCFLPDGTLYELAARGTMPNERGDGDETDWSAMYEQWMADYVAALEPCPEGLDPNTIENDVVTCRLPDGSVYGPMPLFAAGPGDMVEDGEVDDIATTTGAADDENPMTLWFLAGGVAALGAAIAFTRIRRTTR